VAHIVWSCGTGELCALVAAALTFNVASGGLIANLLGLVISPAVALITNNELKDLILAAGTYKELLDDSLMGKLFNFTSKNRLKREVTRNCANTGSFVTFPGSLAGKVQIMPSRRVL